MYRATNLLLLAVIAACARERPADHSAATAVASAVATPQTIGSIERLDPAMDSLVPPGATIEVLARGFDWAEGPIWVPDGEYLLFSDVPQNRIYQWKDGAGLKIWLEPSGYTGDVPRGGEPGSNGLRIDAQGRLVLCQHGDRRIARLDAPLTDPKPVFTTLADRYEGKRLSSPNDLVFDSHGVLYFTDPPYGLPHGPGDPTQEIPFNGVYRLGPDGVVTLLTDSLSRPNGIGLSPDEHTLYVSNSDSSRAVWMAYDLLPSGGIARARVFFDATALVADTNPGLPDGLKVDRTGNLFGAGPGGILVFSPDGRHLGTIRTTLATANEAFNSNGTALYMTADSLLLRVRLRSE
jgi:gluconolactonase